jgi:uncharacterized phage protein gp47/JayE
MAGVSALAASLPSFPTSAELADNLRQAVSGLKSLVSNFNTGGLTQTYLESIAIALGSDASTLPNSNVAGAYELLNTIMKAAYIATASGIYLDLKAADVGVFRKPATNATTSVLFEDSVPAPAGGTFIAAGAVVSSEPADPTQNPVLFTSLVNVTIAAGAITSAAVACLAVAAGSAGNVPANTVTTVQSGTSSLICYNPAPGVGGTDKEGDDAPNGGLRARALAAIINASQCTVSALAEAALSYPGITSSAVANNTAIDGVTFERGNVLIYCDDGTGNLGSTADANHASLVAFQADLTAGKWQAAGVFAVALGSVLLETTIALTIDVAASYLALGYTTALVAVAVQTAVYALVAALPLGAPVTLASIIETGKAVSGCSNVLIPSVSINGVAADLIALPQQVPRCANGPSDVTVTVNTTTTYS